jgi:predicted DNA-binding transcriptional regulator AlpA
MSAADIVNFDSLPDTAVVRLSTLIKGNAPVVPLSNASIYRLMACGKFPKSHRIGLRTAVWKVSDIRAWLNNTANADVVPAAQHLTQARKRKTAILGATA